jgi:acyl dehydratase
MSDVDTAAASELPVDPTAFHPLATQAGRDLPVGFEIETSLKKITLDKSRIFQGWPAARNRHTDYPAAQATGLREPNINGAQSAEILGELFIKFFGTGYIGGTMAINFLGFVVPNDELQAKAVLVEKRVEGERVRLLLDIWLENQRGQKVLAGTASGLVP